MRNDSPLHTRRGIAAALVLIGLAMMFVMSLGFLAARDNALPIGQNAESVFRARSAAQEGMLAALAYAHVRTRDWNEITAPAATNGVLLASQQFPSGGDVLVTATVQDMITQSDPTSETEYFDLFVSGDASGLVQRTRSYLFAPSRFLPLDGYHNVDLAEFAIFARGNIALTGTTEVGRWLEAPLSKLGRKLRLGSAGPLPPAPYIPGTLTITADVEVENSVYYFNAGPASITAAAVIINQSGNPVEGKSIGVIPMLDPPGPPTAVGASSGSLEVPAGVTWPQITTSGTYSDILTRSGGTLQLRGPAVGSGPALNIGTDDFLRLEPTSTLLIEGHVILVVDGSFELLSNLTSGAYIDLRGPALLEVHVGDRLICDDGYIGDEIVHGTGLESKVGYTDVSRIRFFSIPGSASAWTIQGDSVVKAQLYAPTSDVDVLDGARILGRIAGRNVTVTDAFVLFDHALDERIGYTSPYAGFRAHSQEADDLRSAYTGLGSSTEMDDANLQVLALLSRMRVRAFGKEYTPLTPAVVLDGPASIEFTLVTLAAPIAGGGLFFEVPSP